MAAMLCPTLATSEVPKGLQPVGAVACVSVERDGSVVLEASARETAGVVSAPMELPEGTDAVMVQAIIEGAAARSVTLSVHESGSGDPLAYWQNPLAMDEPAAVTALLRLTRRAESVRLFVGTHERASSAVIHDLRWFPLRGAASHHSLMYGAGVDRSRTVGQTFTASGRQLAGIQLRTRNPVLTGDVRPDLDVRLYAWQGHPSKTRRTPPLAQTRVPARLIPAGPPGVDADVMVPLAAPTEPGQRYFIELSGANFIDKEQRFLLWCGPDGYPGGDLYRKDRQYQWDLHMDIYEGSW